MVDLLSQKLDGFYMSRRIEGVSRLDTDHELYQKEIIHHKLLLTRNNHRLYLFLMSDNRIIQVRREESTNFPIGTILIGKVANVKAEMGGAFVHMDAQEIGYLPIYNPSAVAILNRTADGRILAGDEILIRIEKEPIKMKKALLSPVDDAELLTLAKTRTVYSVIKKTDVFYLEFLKQLPHDRRQALQEIVTDQKDVYKHLLESEIGIPCRLYEDDKISLEKVYALPSKIKELLAPKAYMKSGAYLIIEPTEALVVIDVNSGKFEKNIDPDEYVFYVNKEAVKEVFYQLEARNLSGIIIVDFINMKSKQYKQELIHLVEEEAEKALVKTVFSEYSKLGLVEMTRKKQWDTFAKTMRDWKFI